VKTFPCPHDRELTERELDQIAAHGLEDYRREQRKRKRNKQDHGEGDEWKNE
jgi:hypothetical protein